MSNPNDYTFRDSEQAFSAAIEAGVLSLDKKAQNFAGHFMYMHTEADGRDAFKNIDSRRYVWN